MPSSQPLIDVDALGVVGVVHRVGLRDARDEAALDLGGLGQAELLDLALGELDEVLVARTPTARRP